MGARIRLRRRVTSGVIKDPELHQERLTDIRLRREVVATIVSVVIGAFVFLVVAAAMSPPSEPNQPTQTTLPR